MSAFEGRVVHLPGAGRGIGRALAEALASHGAAVAAKDISPVGLDETVSRLTGLTREAARELARIISASMLRVRVSSRPK